MPLHDAYLRRTPFERLFPDGKAARTHLDAITTGMEAGETDGTDPGAFTMTEVVGGVVDALRRAEDGAEQRHQLAVALFHAWHLDRTGGEHHLVPVAVARWAVEVGPGATTAEAEGAADERGPSGVDGEADAPIVDSRYLQLPQHLFWARESDDATPLTLDGIFETRIGDAVNVMGVTGVGPDGTGFSVLPLPPLPLADAPIWRTETMREDGDDFRSTLPGAELEGMYEIRTAGEMLKLVARLGEAEVGSTESPPETAPTDGPSSPPPSVLPFRRLTLDRS